MYASESFSSSRSAGGALPAAAQWIEGLLLGTAGTSIAVLAVAILGFATLQGRLPQREGIRVALGCFILFGAAAVASAITGIASDGNSLAEIQSPVLMDEPIPATLATSPSIVAPPPTRAPGGNPFDPHGGPN